MSFSHTPSLPYLTRTRHKHSTSIALSTPSSPKDYSPLSKLLDTPKPFSLPKVSRASFFSKSPSVVSSPTGPDTILKSKGFFGSTLQELGTDEIDMNKDPLARRRTVKFDLTSDKEQTTVDNERKEDSNERLRTMRGCLREITEIRRIRMKEGNNLYGRDDGKLAKLIEDAFLAMNIQVKEIRQSVDDSAMLIEPIEEDQDLLSFYYMLIQEISEFPFAFVSKLKILVISICSDVDLCNPSYMQILKQKMNNGLFVLQLLQTREAIREHWYKVVLYHLVKAEPRFYTKWKEFFGIITCKKGEMEDLVHTLKCILRPDKTSKLGLPQAEDKIRFMKDELMKFEPMLFSEDWSTLKKKEQLY